MSFAGFVLAGGRSSRMGRDKALLPYGSKTLLEHAAEQVLGAVGNVTLIGDPAKYESLGYPVFPDRVPDCGPLGGIYTALSCSKRDWNVILSCDIPMVCSTRLQQLQDAVNDEVECVAPAGEDGRPEPLCAIYHRCCLTKVEHAIREKSLRMSSFIAELSTVTLRGWSQDLFTNINSPTDWEKLK